MNPQHAWNRIEAWLGQHAAPMLRDLLPPASDDDLGRVAQVMGDLPESYVAAMRVHEGQSDDGTALLGGWRLLSIAEGLSAREMWNRLRADDKNTPILDESVQADPGVQPVWWSDRWLPIATDEAASYLCVDFAPTSDGTPGQLVTLLHDHPARQIVARDLAGWLALAADAMENGAVEVQDIGYGSLLLRYRGWGVAGPDRSN